MRRLDDDDRLVYVLDLGAGDADADEIFALGRDARAPDPRESGTVGAVR